jgi:hypothetical protein
MLAAERARWVVVGAAIVITGCSGPSTEGAPPGDAVLDGSAGLSSSDGSRVLPDAHHADDGAVEDVPVTFGPWSKVPAGVPSGPYGIEAAQTVDPNHCWDGYAEDASNPELICMGSYYDPDGSKGIGVLLVTQSTEWCDTCNAEADDLPKRFGGPWQGLGVHVLELMVEADDGPATLQTARAWQSDHRTTWSIGVDTAGSFLEDGKRNFPVNVVIDPRTMKVTDRFDGDGPPVTDAVRKVGLANQKD